MSQEEWICARNAEKLFIQAKKQVDAAVQLPKNLKDYLRKKRFRAGQKSAEFQCASAVPIFLFTCAHQFYL